MKEARRHSWSARTEWDLAETPWARQLARLRAAGAKEIHMRISSPPMRFPCFMGVDICSTKELIAAGRTVEEWVPVAVAETLHALLVGA